MPSIKRGFFLDVVQVPIRSATEAKSWAWGDTGDHSHPYMDGFELEAVTVAPNELGCCA